MFNFLTACSSMLCARYNTVVGTAALVRGTNFFVGVVPDKPDKLVALLPVPSISDAGNPTKRATFQLICRGMPSEQTVLRTQINTLYSIMGNKSNNVCGYPGLIEPLEELGAAGYDANKLLIHTAQFSFTTTKTNL